MTVRQLDPEQAERLRRAPYTYDCVGQTARGPVAGFHWFERSARLQRSDFEAAAAELLAWQVQARAGLQVATSELPLRQETVVLMRLGAGRLALSIPCRVAYVIDEPDLRGFAYGTLPGHPEAGEERFALRRHDDGSIEMTVAALSRPASVLAKLGGPLTRRAQAGMTGRYLRALDRA